MTSIMSSDFHFLVPESFHKELVQIGKIVSEKIQFEFLYGVESTMLHTKFRANQHAGSVDDF